MIDQQVSPSSLKNHFSYVQPLDNSDWSFSSGEYYPPSFEELYPTEFISAEERADFECVTSGRMNYFCEKYLLLSDVTGECFSYLPSFEKISKTLHPKQDVFSIFSFLEIRQFQHLAQVKLIMYKEHLYEFFHFIRRHTNLLNEIQQIANQVKNEQSSNKRVLLTKKLLEIREKSNFVSDFPFNEK